MSEEEVVEEENTLRDDLEAAFEDDVPETKEETSTEEVVPDGGVEETADPVGEGSTGVSEAVQPDAEPAAGGEAKAPVDWSPELREEWGQLSSGVKEQVMRREQQIAQAMHGTAQARKIQEDMNHITQQFGSVMQADGFPNPQAAIQNYLQIATKMRMGTPAEKAQTVSELINHYGVDIATLDSVLAGETPQDPQISQMEQMLDQRMAPVNQMMQNLAGMQQQKQQMSGQQAQNSVNQFAQKAEFINDVRGQMADMLDLATQQGRSMELQEAYDIACQMNPGIKAVLDKRAQQDALLPKQRAATSISGTGQGSSAKPSDDLGDVLRDAWNAQLE